MTEHLSVDAGKNPIAPTVPMAQDAAARKIEKATRFQLRIMAKQGVGIYFVPVEMGTSDGSRDFKGGAIFMNIEGLMPYLEQKAREWLGKKIAEQEKADGKAAEDGGVRGDEPGGSGGSEEAV